MHLKRTYDWKRKLKCLVVCMAVIIALLAFLFVFLLIKSPGKPDPFLDDTGLPVANSISEKTFVEIGGVRQGMFIRGLSLDNPVLLYVHGGPAFPNYFMIDTFKPGLEEYFTVCYWEQRGGGLSYTPDVSLESMNIDQFTDDAIEVSNYLRSRFNQDRIYILAHSGGTPIALQAVHKAPELFAAYIAMAQITNQKESERRAYTFMLNTYTEKGNTKAVNSLLQYDILESDTNIVSYNQSVIRDKSMHELGIGTMHQMGSVFWDIFVPVWTCKAYTLQEKVKIWKSKFSFLPKTTLIKEILSTDFTYSIQDIDIPVYFISGKHDLTVNIDLSKAYLNQLRAPLKGFYTFNNSAHSPLFEEPEKFRQIIEQDILKKSNGLRDAE